MESLNRIALVDVEPCIADDLPIIFNNYDVFWFRLGFKIDKYLILNSTRLKVIVTPVTGIDHIDELACKEKNIKILCLRGEYDFLKEVRATAEHTFALVFALLRNIPEAILSVKNGRWNRDLFRGRELFGKKVGIVGFGRLGEIAAFYFHAFGCEVKYFDIVTKSSDYAVAASSLNEIASCDIISIHVNYSQDTHHLIDKEFFDLCSPGTIFINTSRGGIVNEKALLSALKSGKLAAAALDVIQDEFNFSSANELVEYSKTNSNLLITPHIGGNTYESFEKTEFFLASKLINMLADLDS